MVNDVESNKLLEYLKAPGNSTLMINVIDCSLIAPIVLPRLNYYYFAYQIQDAMNYLQLSTEKVEEMRNMNNFSSGREVSKVLVLIDNIVLMTMMV